MKIYGAIFDLDGTLIDSMKLWGNLGSEFLIANKLPVPPMLREILKPMTLADAARYFKEEFDFKASEESLLNQLSGLIHTQYTQTIPAKGNIRPLLECFKARKIPMGIATATEKNLACPALTRLKMDSYFSFLLTCSEENTTKETPYIFEQARLLLNSPKQETVVFEDSLHAAFTAKQAGFPVIGIYDQYTSSAWPQMKQLCDFAITDYSELEVTKENCINYSRI